MTAMTENWNSSYLYGTNADFIEELYERYLADPLNLEPRWKNYFDSLQDGGKKDVAQGDLKEKFAIITQQPNFSLESGEVNHSQAQVWRLIEAYRILGVTYADLDPLERKARIRPKELDLATYGLTNELNNEFYADLDFASAPKLALKDIVAKYDAIYSSKVGFEFAHIGDLAEQEWLKNYVETKYLNYTLANDEKLQLLQKLTEAEGLERYLHVKYVGQKRFSLEGGDSFIPALDRVINQASKHGVKEIYIGMAHRGRLNTLVNIVGKLPKKLFDEFEGNYPTVDFMLSGDVKYHKGGKCNYITKHGMVKTTLAFNPSHLEVVNPVVNGIVRARQDKIASPDSVMGILVHGDSALIGLGTNQGVFNMSQTRAYGVDGMLHIVINNQLGFTNSDIRDNRSSRYCTDIAKMAEAPVIHVNADDMESIAFVMDLAVDYRSKFKKDIMLDLVGFRRHGHNESDDPTLTQPLMYRQVKAHPGARKLYADKLVANGTLTEDDVLKMAEDYRLGLNQGVHIKADTMQVLSWYDEFDIKPVLKAKSLDKISTVVENKQILAITNAVTILPTPEFKLHPTLARLLEVRKAMGQGEQPIDFGMAETLAYGSLLQQGISVRISGEDTARGTFSHRQAVWHDVNRDDLSDSGYLPLTRLENNSKFHIYDSVLNEECVLGFEYGYSTTNLRDFVMWEAQYGDFANGAQVIIDQYIASGEVKWGQLSNVALMLPHGLDGSGPEHSSARLERFLQLCAESNIQVVVPTTAAQMFHLIRHKALTNWIKPLVIIMSKRLLRFKGAMSYVSEFTGGGFKTVITDVTVRTTTVKKVIICSGQVYYDLLEARSEHTLDNEVAIIRLEQLYPFPLELLKNELSQFVNAKNFVWVQEEPHNQGAWLQIRDGLNAILGDKGQFTEVSRPASAAPACGMSKMHTEQLQQLLVAAFA